MLHTPRFRSLIEKSAERQPRVQVREALVGEQDRLRVDAVLFVPLASGAACGGHGLWVGLRCCAGGPASFARGPRSILPIAVCNGELLSCISTAPDFVWVDFQDDFPKSLFDICVWGVTADINSEGVDASEVQQESHKSTLQATGRRHL